MRTRERGRLEERAEREGRIARACGSSLAANPYGAPGQRLFGPPDQDLWRKAWVRGWNQTDAELRDVGFGSRDRPFDQKSLRSGIEARPLPKQAA